VRFAAPALLVLLVPAIAWASFTIINYPFVNTLSTGSVTLSGPTSVAVDGQGHIYIADSGNHQVVEVTSDGVASVVSFPGLSPALASAAAVAVDGSGNLYVADNTTSRVVKLSGGAATVVATASLLTNPSGLAFDAAGDLYIADVTHNYIVKMPAGGTAAVLNITGLGTALSQPYGLAVDISGNLYIADSANSRIVEVTTGGVGSALTISGETLNTPLGVAVDALGNVYVADEINSRVVVVAPGGAASVLDAPLFGSFTDPVPLTVTHPSGIALNATGTIYIADTGDNHVVEAMPSAANFGHLPSTASSGATLTLSFLLGQFPTIGSVQTYTLGTPGLDFTVVSGSGTTCVTGFTGSGSDVPCTVEVSFLPTAAGLRRGALVIYDNETPPEVLITIPLYGTVDAPLAALSPGTASLANLEGATLDEPFQIALDGAGDMYVANYAENTGNVVKIPASGSASVVNTGEVVLQGATGVVLDGAGNLYIADHIAASVLEVTAAGVTSTLNISGLSPALGFPVGLAMDSAGNLYIGDYSTGRAIKATPAGGSTWLGSVVATPGFTFQEEGVYGVAVDAAGTVYIADHGNSRILKVTAAGAASAVAITGVTPALSSPQGVGVDAFGNLYIDDAGNSRIVEVTTAGVASVVQTPGLTPGLVAPFGVSVDPLGNLLVPDLNNRIVKVSVAGANLSFPSTHVGASSSSQTATVTNLGNLPLVFSTNPTFTQNFSQPTASTNQCLINTSLTGGGVCGVSVQFTPQSVGSLSASITLTNDNLNLSGSTQTVSVSGTGLVALADATSTAVSVTPTSAAIGQPLRLTATVTDTTHSSTIPTGSVTFMDTVGSTSVSLNGGAPVSINAGQSVLTGVTLSGAGVHTIAANYAGVSGAFLTSSNTTTLTISKDTETITGPSQPFQVVIGQTGSLPVTVTGPYGVVAAPSGSLSYNIVNSSSTSVASGTATLIPGETSSTGTVPIPSSLPPGTYTVSVNYGGDSNYSGSATATNIQVIVGQIAPIISWTQPSGINYGVTLASSLTASAASGENAVPGTFSYTATPAGGTAIAVTSATVLNAGAYTLTVTFIPTDTTTYKITTDTAMLMVSKATPTVALATSLDTVLVTNAVTFTATVSSSVGTPGGSVNFFDGETLLGSVTLASGLATYTTSNLVSGIHTITAQFGGSGNFASLTSSAVTETVENFSLAIAPSGTPSATATPGGTATYALVIGPTTGTTFPAPVTLSLSGLPTGATAQLTPDTLPAGAGPTNVALTVQLPFATASFGRHEILALLLPATMTMGALFLPFSRRIRRAAGKRGAFLLLLLLTMIGISLLGSTGCGTTSSGFIGHRPTTYVLTVTGTSGSLSHSTTVNLTVQ
jgi:sugar lactone lactonase YvrE